MIPKSSGTFAAPGKRLTTLTKRDDPHFFTVLHDRHNRYNVGMPCAKQVRHVQYNMNPVRPNLRLKLDPTAPCVDVGNVVRDELDMDLGSVYMRPRAVLLLDKRSRMQRNTSQKELVDVLQYTIDFVHVDAQQFVLLPFVKETGVVIPYRVLCEDIDHIEYESLLMAPGSYSENDRRGKCRSIDRLNALWKK